MSKKTRKTSAASRDPERSRDAAAPSAPPEAPAPPRSGLLLLSAALSAALPIAASFLPDARLWGINHLAFVSPTLRWALVALIVLAFVPGVARAVYRGLLSLCARASSAPPRASLVAVVVVAVASVALFHQFRSATLLLGDGQLLVQSFDAAQEGHGTVIMRSAGAIVTEETIAPGTTLLYYGAVQLAADQFKKSPVDGMRMLNCVLGGGFVFLLLAAARTRRILDEPRLWLLVLGLFSCSILLFFGYIENYTAPLLFVTMYAMLAFRALHGLGSPWLAVIPLVCAIYAHIQCVLFVPSFVYLVLWKMKPAWRGRLLQRWVPVFTALAVTGVAAFALLPSVRKFYVPLGFGNAQYALLSPHHLADIANEILMLFPIVPVVAVLGWVGRRAERTPGRDPLHDPRARKDPTSWFSHPAEWQLVASMLVPCVLYLLLFHPAIGMARDWDLFTMATVALVPLTLLALNRYLRATGVGHAVTARFAVPALAVTVATGVSWVAVNASLENTITRFTSILEYDRTHASYAWENLAVLQHDRGKLQEAIDIMETAVEHSKNPRQIVRLAVYIEEAGRIDEAIAMLEQVLERRPDFSKARFRLVLFLEKKQDWVKMLPAAEAGVKYNPEDGVYHFFYAESLLRAGRTQEALTVFRRCRTTNLPADIMQYVEGVLAQHGAP